MDKCLFAHQEVEYDNFDYDAVEELIESYIKLYSEEKNIWRDFMEAFEHVVPELSLDNRESRARTYLDKLQNHDVTIPKSDIDVMFREVAQKLTSTS